MNADSMFFEGCGAADKEAAAGRDILSIGAADSGADSPDKAAVLNRETAADKEAAAGRDILSISAADSGADSPDKAAVLNREAAADKEAAAGRDILSISAADSGAAAELPVGRWAPSPSGRMHLGNLACCLLAWLSAKSRGGRIVLRIEDLDAERCPRAFADLLEQDLAWLGLAADEGGSAGGPAAPYYQSECAAIYHRAYDTLSAKVRVYPCFCTRSQLHAASAPHRGDGQVVYPGTCRALSPAQTAQKSLVRPPAWRVAVPDETIRFCDGHLGPVAENLARDCGDFIVRRADGGFAYQLAVVVDDARMGVTEVVRGGDLLASTARQLWLYRVLGLRAPRFFHLPLLLAPDGRRLSKRDGDESLEHLRARFTPAEIVGRLAFLYGLQPTPAPRTPQSLLPEFDWQKVPKEDVRIPPGLF